MRRVKGEVGTYLEISLGHDGVDEPAIFVGDWQKGW
jgi:hypothetical protein